MTGARGLVAVFVVAAALGAAEPGAAASCERGETVVRVETRSCSVPPRSPARLVARACCKEPSGRIRCQPFPDCPPRSPS